MRLKGKSIPLPKPVTISIHRGTEVFTLVAKAVLSDEKFLELLSPPEPPTITKVGGSKSKDFKDQRYLEAKKNWDEKRSSWFILEALSDTEGLEWEKIDIKDPETYIYLEEELKIFTPQEQARIFEAINEAQNPTGKTEEQALENFIQRLLQQDQPLSSASPEPTSTESGKVAND